VEHDIVGSPSGPTRGHAGARPFYESLFTDLSDSKVECLRRLYGDGFEFAESGAIQRENVWLDLAAIIQQLPQD